MDDGKTYYLELMSHNDKNPSKREMTVFAIMTAKKALPSERTEFMVNYRVENIEQLLKDLKSNGD